MYLSMFVFAMNGGTPSVMGKQWGAVTRPGHHNTMDNATIPTPALHQGWVLLVLTSPDTMSETISPVLELCVHWSPEQCQAPVTRPPPAQ